MFQFLFTGLFLGFSAGISPGPLLALVISQTLRHGRKEGIKTSLSPLITDMPIILFSVFVVGELAHFSLVLAIISWAGALYMIFLGYESFTAGKLILPEVQENPASIKKGMITNLLNPHPWLFWITVGAPQLYHAFQLNRMATVLFLSGFYFSLLGSKIAIACITDYSRGFMKERTYHNILQVLGVTLWLFAILLIYGSIQYLK